VTATPEAGTTNDRVAIIDEGGGPAMPDSPVANPSAGKPSLAPRSPSSRLARFYANRTTARLAWPNKRHLAVLIAAAAAVGGVPGIAVAMSANTPPKPAPVTVLCQKDEHMITKTGVDIRNNNFLGEPECLMNWNDSPGFVITKSGAHTPWAAYPNTFAGCEISVCSPHSAMPIRVSDIRGLNSTWRFVPSKRWVGNAAYDIWLDPHDRTRGEDTGAEIMLWLDSSKLAAPRRAPAVKIDGTWWWISLWTTHHNGISWHYLRFWRERPTTTVTNLNLLPFLAFAERYHNAIRSNWWLTGVEAGYELCSGGVGTDTELYAVKVSPKPAPFQIKKKPPPDPKPKPTPTPTLPPAPAPSPVPSTLAPTA
jgi:hypothetical protein